MSATLPPSVPSPSPVSSWLRTASDAVTLKPEPYQRLAAQPSLRSALLIILVVGLIIGASSALLGIPGLFRSPAEQIERGITSFEDALDQAMSFSGQSTPEAEAVIDLIKSSIETWRPFIQQLADVQAPLPSFFGRFFSWIGDWLSSPFSLLASWLLLSIWIMLFARLLGGRGSLVAYLSASSLSVIPSLLNLFGFIPCLGGVLALAAWVWALMIQYKAVQVSHGLSQGRSILAVLLPYILLVLLITILTIAFAGLLVSLINSFEGVSY